MKYLANIQTTSAVSSGGAKPKNMSTAKTRYFLGHGRIWRARSENLKFCVSRLHLIRISCKRKSCEWRFNYFLLKPVGIQLESNWNPTGSSWIQLESNWILSGLFYLALSWQMDLEKSGNVWVLARLWLRVCPRTLLCPTPNEMGTKQHVTPSHRAGGVEGTSRKGMLQCQSWLSMECWLFSACITVVFSACITLSASYLGRRRCLKEEKRAFRIWLRGSTSINGVS